MVTVCKWIGTVAASTAGCASQFDPEFVVCEVQVWCGRDFNEVKLWSPRRRDCDTDDSSLRVIDTIVEPQRSYKFV